MTKRSSDVEQSIDALYDATPAAFTKERDALAKRLKTEGSGAESAQVKALRKPTAIAYVLNQLARRYPDELAELVDVGRVLARAQRKAIRGEAGHDLREAIVKQRAVVAALTHRTATVMKELGLAATGHLDEVASALQSALVDPAVGEQLEEGRLAKVPAAAAGFPGTSAGPEAEEGDERETEPSVRTPSRAVTARARAAPAPAEDAKARERAKVRERAAAEARAKAEAGERAAAERRAKITELQAHAAKLESEAKQAATLASDAKRAAAVAAKTATAALAKAKRARQEAERATDRKQR